MNDSNLNACDLYDQKESEDIINIKKVKCELECSNKYKYKCPTCKKLICSLSCFNKHKILLNCSGKFSYFENVPIFNFTETVLERDSKFLDTVGVKVEGSARILSKQLKNRLLTQVKHTTGKKTFSIALLKKKCEEREIHLRLCSAELCRRKENTTTLSRRGKKISWRVEWKFTNFNQGYVDKAICEDTILNDLLSRFVKDNVEISVNSVEQNLRLFTSLDSIEVFLENNDIQTCNGRKWLIIDKDKKLLDILKGKHIIEYPVFHLVLSNSEEYRLYNNNPSELCADQKHHL